MEILNKEKDSQISILKEQISVLQNEVKTLKLIVAEEHLEHYKCILSENEYLWKETADMKEYLKTYGNIWIGEKKT